MEIVLLPTHVLFLLWFLSNALICRSYPFILDLMLECSYFPIFSEFVTFYTHFKLLMVSDWVLKQCLLGDKRELIIQISFTSWGAHILSLRDHMYSLEGGPLSIGQTGNLACPRLFTHSSSEILNLWYICHFWYFSHKNFKNYLLPKNDESMNVILCLQ